MKPLIDVDGVQIASTERKGEGTPLLLITGIGAHIEMWAPLGQRVDRPLSPSTRPAPAARTAKPSAADEPGWPGW